MTPQSLRNTLSANRLGFQTLLLVNDPAMALLEDNSEIGGPLASTVKPSPGPSMEKADLDWKNSKCNLFSKDDQFILENFPNLL